MENSGSAQVFEGGHIPTFKLDSLGIKDGSLDYIQLDVEGFEVWALKGAKQLLDDNSPVISIEMRGHGNDRYAVNFLTEQGYTQVAKVRFDGVFAKVPQN
jgi:hypothetical protein